MSETAEHSPATLVILGASGDLTKRQLLQGLGSLLAAQPTREVTLIGADIAEMSGETWRDLVCRELIEGGCAAGVAGETASRSEYHATDLLNEEDLKLLLGATEGPTVLYFALAPHITIGVCELLANLNLPDRFRLGLEKPFGTDGASAREFNELLTSFAAEEQLFRVDHFLGTSPILNVLQLRFANRILRELWNADHIADIEVVFDEVLTLEGRAGYYDNAGALIDMLQSHLLLVLAVLVMEEPHDLGSEALRDRMSEALQAMRPWGGDPAGSSRRARYSAGTISGRAVPDYLEEEGVDPANDTETLASLVLEVDSDRWSGVPFTVRSGKATGADRWEIVVTFKPVERLPAGLGIDDGTELANQIAIDLGPALVALRLVTNDSDWRALNSTVLRGGGPGVRLLPYAQVLEGMLDGDPVLAVRGDIAEELWRICDPVLEAWRSGRTPMETYPAGSAGPEAWQRAPEYRRFVDGLETPYAPDPEEVKRQRRGVAYPPEYRVAGRRP